MGVSRINVFLPPSLKGIKAGCPPLVSYSALDLIFLCKEGSKTGSSKQYATHATGFLEREASVSV